MSSGEQPCAGHDVVLQLLGPLMALTHGSSARCAAARAALMGVLLPVLRWSHSKTQVRGTQRGRGADMGTKTETETSTTETSALGQR
jgi:hypothetical protein